MQKQKRTIELLAELSTLMVALPAAAPLIATLLSMVVIDTPKPPATADVKTRNLAAMAKGSKPATPLPSLEEDRKTYAAMQVELSLAAKSGSRHVDELRARLANVVGRIKTAELAIVNAAPQPDEAMLADDERRHRALSFELAAAIKSQPDRALALAGELATLAKRITANRRPSTATRYV